MFAHSLRAAEGDFVTAAHPQKGFDHALNEMEIQRVVHAVLQHTHVVAGHIALIALDGDQQIFAALFVYQRAEIAQRYAKRRKAGIQFRLVFKRHVVVLLRPNTLLCRR